MKFKEDVLVTNDGRLYASEIDLGKHSLIVDEPVDHGGEDYGPTAIQLMLGSLGSCTVITVRMYAHRKQWDLKKINMNLNLDTVQQDGLEKTIIYRKLEFEGELDAEQRKRLLEIADKCPVHKILSGSVEFRNFN